MTLTPLVPLTMYVPRGTDNHLMEIGDWPVGLTAGKRRTGMLGHDDA